MTQSSAPGPAADPHNPAVTFHLVGHAHIDPVWLWDWREGVETVRATFRSALDRLHENPDMVFAHSSAAQYAWLEHFPDLLAEVRAAVERGQWEVLGGWWVEPDVNLPHGEALARQALHGQRTFQRLLGRRASVGFLPDSFGHPATLPQLLALSGLDAFVFMRPNAAELELPQNLFRWVGIDGTSLLSARIEAYSSNPHHVESSLERNLHWRPADAAHWLGFYGVGNHGGGPTKRSIENLRRLNADPNWPTLKMDSCAAFFGAVRGEALPTYAGELQHHARGCYSAVSEIKRLNRHAEHRLLRAEKLAVLAGTFGYAYPQAELERAWKRLLFNQFHDVLAGSSIARAYDDAREQLGEALATASEVEFFAMQSVAAQVDTRQNAVDVPEVIRSVRWDGPTWVTDYGDGVPILVFNSSGTPRREALEIELNDWHTPDLKLTDDQGQELAYQQLQPESLNGGRPRFVFMADLPSGGHRLYRALAQAPAPVAETGLRVSTHSNGNITLENAFLSAEISAGSGSLRRLYDKVRGLEWLAGHAAQVQVVSDATDTWGHGLTHLRELTGLFGEATLQVLSSGPLRATVRAATRWGRSWVTQDYTLDASAGHLAGRVELDWNERHSAAQLVFPLALSQVEATFEVPYGCAVRPPDGQEEPVGSWLNVSGALRDARGQLHPAGAALMTDCKASASVLGGEMRLTLARSPIYAHHDPATPQPGRPYTHTDQGRQELRWQLRLHTGDWRTAAIPAHAEHFNQPLTFTREHVHAGELPPLLSLLHLEGLETVNLSALKRAEEGDALIFRLHEWAGQSGQGTLVWNGQRLAVQIRPHQVLSLRLEPGGRLQLVNFVEDAL